MTPKPAAHTPTPWINSLGMMATRTPEEVAAFAGPNEAYVLRAVNAHEELLKAVKTMHGLWHKCESNCSIVEAIAKAEGK